MAGAAAGLVAPVTAEWMELAARVDTAIAPVHDSSSLRHDPQAIDRIEWLPSETHAADLLAVIE